MDSCKAREGRGPITFGLVGCNVSEGVVCSGFVSELDVSRLKFEGMALIGVNDFDFVLGSGEKIVPVLFGEELRNSLMTGGGAPNDADDAAGNENWKFGSAEYKKFDFPPPKKKRRVAQHLLSEELPDRVNCLVLDAVS